MCDRELLQIITMWRSGAADEQVYVLSNLCLKYLNLFLKGFLPLAPMVTEAVSSPFFLFALR